MQHLTIPVKTENSSRAALKLMVLLSLSTTFSTSYSPPENAQLSGRNQSPVMEIDLHAPSRSFATSSKWKCFFNTKKCPRFTNFAIALRAKRAYILAWKKCQKWSIQQFLKICSLRSNSITIQVNSKRTKIGGKYKTQKVQIIHFW